MVKQKYLEEKKSDLNLYRLFFSFANLRWSTNSSSETENSYLLNSEGKISIHFARMTQYPDGSVA